MKKFVIKMLFLLMVFIILLAWKQTHQSLQKNTISEPEVLLYLHEQNDTMSLLLEDYIVGTVAAEMPASFGMEALKAQAVCARTYALKKLIEKRTYPKGADLSDDIYSCQAFRNVFSSSPNMRKENLERVKEAVKATRGEIMLYQSEPIDALYHSTCGGKTDSAWGISNNAPYLHSVKCNYCKESPHYQDTYTVKNEKLNALVGESGSRLTIKTLSWTPSGRLNEISINGKKIYASKLRQELGLPSQWITFHVGRKETEINCRGYGHGLGLCQYGANGLSQKGKNYRQILEYYYQDIEFYHLPY